MNRRALECFIALAEESHFHRAADRCHISQSGISQQLRRLEDELGVQLMLRNNRQVSLTPSGTVFLGEARRIVADMDSAVHLAQQINEGLIGRLTVGATASSLFILLPEILGQFRGLRPNVFVDVQHLTTAEQEVALRRGEIQIGICHPPLDDSELCCSLLATLPFDVVMHERHPLAERARLHMADLSDETFIMFPRQVGSRLYDSIIALCHQEGFSPRRIVEAAPVQSIIAMAACAAGIGFVASQIQHLPRAGVVYRRINGPAPHFTLGVAHAGRQPGQLVSDFVDIAVRVAATIE